MHLPDRSRTGADIPAGQVVAQVHGGRETYEVSAQHGGQVLEWLVEEGDPVAPGQPVVRLHPAEVTG
ncbi:MAG: hypothetical protein CSB46_08135 [Micrococcales bacterium]|nr:MAG: hypothetical protein CSB46_08135 [Micrococcales bacterium]